MIDGWKTCALGDVCVIKYGKDHKHLDNGEVPVYGSGGIIRYVNTMLYNKKSVLIPRKGTLKNLFFVKDPFWTVDTLFYTQINEAKIVPEYLYYFLKTINLETMNVGTAVPSLTVSVLSEIKMSIPSLDEQKRIASILSTLDDKIELNKKINKTLEEMAKAIWAEKFGNSNENGLLGDIIELFDYKRVPIPSEKRKLMKNIYPYYGAASLMDYVDNYLFDGIYVLLGEDGTVTDNLGYPMLQYVWGKFWVNNHAHIMRGRNGFTVESLYILLKHTNVRSIVTGAVQPKINQMNLKNLSVFIPKIEDLENFNKLIDPMFSSIRVRSIENIHLFSIRDILLPKLMSGEIRVK